MQGEKRGVEHQPLGGQNKAGSCLSSSWCLISHGARGGWQRVTVLGYARSPPPLPPEERLQLGCRTDRKAFEAHGRLLEEPPVPEQDAGKCRLAPTRPRTLGVLLSRSLQQECRGAASRGRRSLQPVIPPSPVFLTSGSLL